MRAPSYLPLPVTLLIALMLPLCATVVCGQSPDISLDRTGQDDIATFQLQWRYSPMDSPAFAAPSFDDSAWSALQGKAMLPSRAADTRHLWVRVRIHSGTDDRRRAVLLETKGSVPYQVYANGILIAESPGIAEGHLQRPRPFAIALPAGPDVLLAIRFVSTSFYRIAFMPLISLDLGSPAAVARAAELRRIQEFDEQFTAQILGIVLCLALGLFALVLFLAQPARKEYRWLALFGLLQGMYIACRVLVTSGVWPVTRIELLLYRYAGGTAMICLLEFLLYVARVKGRRVARWLEAVTLLAPFIGVFSEHLFELALIIILLAIATYTVSLLVRAWRLDVTESKLLVPSFSLLIATTCLYFLSQVFPGRVWYPPVLHLGTVGISADDLDVWFLLAEPGRGHALPLYPRQPR